MDTSPSFSRAGAFVFLPGLRVLSDGSRSGTSCAAVQGSPDPPGRRGPNQGAETSLGGLKRSAARWFGGPLAAGRSARSIVRFLPAILVILLHVGVDAAPSVPAVPQSTRAAKPAVQPFTAKVTAVVDGDTLRVVDDRGIEFTIRVDGIDCPESGQPFGGVALRFTRAQVFDRSVQVRIVDTDSRGRFVARVSADGQDLSTQLLRSGLAWHYTDYSHDAALAAAERDARQSKRGLWSEAAAVAPWVWRRQSAAKHASRGPDDEAGPFFANTSSRVFHAASCRNAHCKNCTVPFATAQAAKAAGYRPAGDCLR